MYWVKGIDSCHDVRAMISYWFSTLRLGYTGLSYKTLGITSCSSQWIAKTIWNCTQWKKSTIEQVPLGKSDACGQMVKSTFIEISHNEKDMKKHSFLETVNKYLLESFWILFGELQMIVIISYPSAPSISIFFLVGCFFSWNAPHNRPDVCFFAK